MPAPIVVMDAGYPATALTAALTGVNDDGHAAERVVRHVFPGQHLPPSRPQADQEG
jgi:hypothetical protein